MRLAVSRAPDAQRGVSPLELFFDLVCVFAMGQLSHHLLEHVDLRTAAETVILALAVFYAWYMTAWGVNWLEPDRLPVLHWLPGRGRVIDLGHTDIAAGHLIERTPALSGGGARGP
jgi:low temperature requirement protein LtrA